MANGGSEVIKILKQVRSEISIKFSVASVGVFGSYATGTATGGSDVDILFELREPAFDHHMDLKYYLEEALGRPLDLVIRETIKPRLKPVIEREVVYV